MIPNFDIKALLKSQIKLYRSELQKLDQYIQSFIITKQEYKKRRGLLLHRLNDSIGYLMELDTEGMIRHVGKSRTNQGFDEGIDYQRILDPSFDYFSYIRNLKGSGSANKETTAIKKIQTFLRKPQAKSFLKKEFVKQDAHPYTGHCYVASQVLYDVLGGDNAGYEVYQMDHEGVSHWFLKNKDGTVLDPTVLQFETKPDYAQATHSAFLWTEDGLSKRAQEMKERIF